jgi:DNA-binding MarR family transcriptional regulator
VDYVARLREEWADQLPDLDTSPAEVVARITRIAAIVGRRHESALARHDLTRAELELLAALRRAGRPLRAREVGTVTDSPGATITKRLDHLHDAGLVARSTPERDRRGVLVSLTDAGQGLVDDVFPEQIERERAVVESLSAAEQEVLAALLARVLERIDPVG